MRVYTCQICHGQFETDQTDEDLEAQYAEEFPYASTFDKDPASACDDCYKLISRFADEENLLR